MNVGDIVRLATGKSPRMVVVAIDNETGFVRVVWLTQDGKPQQLADCPPEAFVLVIA